MKRDRIPINKSRIPYRFAISLGGALYTLEVTYNKTADLFTIGLYRNGQCLCAAEPVVYGMPLFADCYKAGKFPAVRIVPWDESGQTQRVTYQNFGDTVFLTIDNAGDAIG